MKNLWQHTWSLDEEKMQIKVKGVNTFARFRPAVAQPELDDTHAFTCSGHKMANRWDRDSSSESRFARGARHAGI